jgi:hypothetical protein
MFILHLPLSLARALPPPPLSHAHAHAHAHTHTHTRTPTPTHTHPHTHMHTHAHTCTRAPTPFSVKYYPTICTRSVHYLCIYFFTLPVITLQDNGAPLGNDVSGNLPLRGGKAQVWEGGMREPGELLVPLLSFSLPPPPTPSPLFHLPPSPSNLLLRFHTPPPPLPHPSTPPPLPHPSRHRPLAWSHLPRLLQYRDRFYDGHPPNYTGPGGYTSAD